jgi:transcriptional regulator with XRE-family HTH domain
LRKGGADLVSALKPNASFLAKEYLKNHGIKQSYVADRMGISYSSLSCKLNGRRKFDADFAIEFSKILNISPDIFLKSSFSK